MYRTPIAVCVIVMSILMIMVPFGSAMEPDTSDPGVILSGSSVLHNQTERISVIDIVPLLHVSSLKAQGTPASVSLITIQPGESLSPNALRPGNEVLFILNGSSEITADEKTVTAGADESVFIPSGSMLMVKNTGSDALKLFSVLSRDNTGGNTTPGFMKRSVESIKPVVFGNESASDQFEVYRILSTFEEFLPLSFDLAIVDLPAGHTIRKHFLESGQISYVLSGKGNVTLGCVSQEITGGDLVYTPPGVVQGFSSDLNLSLLLLTNPYYRPEQDHVAESSCS